MKVAGAVAEFDPFHRGHAYLLEKARSAGATHIAVVMSGAAVQRGEIAVCTKQERAEFAIAHGADLVAELPAPYSCAMARYFADGAVRILGQLGIDALCFGSETDSAAPMIEAARAMDSLDDSEAVRKRLAGGMSYPAALQAAVRELCGEDTAKVLGTPNSTLGVEYVRALGRGGISAEIIPVKRVGAGHDKKSTDCTNKVCANNEVCAANGVFAPSGSELRELLAAGTDIAFGVPQGCVPRTLFDPRLADDILYYRLLTAPRSELLELPEVNEPVADRILKIRRDPPDSLTDFLTEVKTANITLARLRRSALHLVLGVTRADFFEPPYVRILAFNKRGTEILRRAKHSVPISASLRGLEDSSRQAARIAAVENSAVRLQQICRVSPQPRFENEYTRKIVIQK